MYVPKICMLVVDSSCRHLLYSSCTHQCWKGLQILAPMQQTDAESPHRGDSLGQAPPRSGRTSRMADPLIPVAANEAGRSSRNQGAPETTPSGAAAVITSEVDALPGTAWADDEPLHPSSEPAGLAANLTASSQQQPGANSTADSEGDAVEGLAAQSESSSGEEEDSEEVQAALQQLQREIFVAWREAAALRHARRATHTHAGSSRHGAPSSRLWGWSFVLSSDVSCQTIYVLCTPAAHTWHASRLSSCQHECCIAAVL